MAPKGFPEPLVKILKLTLRIIPEAISDTAT